MTLKLDSNTTITGGGVGLKLPGVVNRDVNNLITSVAITGGKTYTPTRNASNYISTITDSINTWTFTRNASNYISNWTVS